MKKYCARTLLLAWVLWEHTVTYAHGSKKEAWRYLDDHYFSWTCEFESYWQAMSLANNARAKFLHWNSVWIYSPDETMELHEYTCFPRGVDSRPKPQ